MNYSVDIGYTNGTLTDTDIARLEKELTYMLPEQVVSVEIIKNIFESADYEYFIKITSNTDRLSREIVRAKCCFSNDIKETDRFTAEILASVEQSFIKVKRTYKKYGI